MKIDNIIEHNDFMTPIVDKLNDLFDNLKTDDKMKNTHESNVVVGDVWDSVNLLNVDFDGREEFFKWMLGYSHLISLSILTQLDYKYIHFVDYIDGEMLIHNHEHAEHYCALIYLNDTGSTVFDDTIVESKVGRVVQFPAYANHSSPKSQGKRVLVLGYKYK